MTREDIIRMAGEEVLRVTADGKFIWNERADEMIASGDYGQYPSRRHILKALRENERLQTENAQLLEQLRLASVDAALEEAEANTVREACNQRTFRLEAEIERLREALKKYGQHRNDCAVTLGGYQCTCGFNQQEQPR